MTERPDLGRVLRLSRCADPAAIPGLLGELGTQMGATDIEILLADFEQVRLLPLGIGDLATGDVEADELATSDVLVATAGVGGGAGPVGRPDAGDEIATTMAGRAFVTEAAVVAARDGAHRIWVPIVEGSSRTGVLALTLADDDPSTVEACEELGLVAGLLVAAHARSTDAYGMARRRRAMTLPASMQWDLLPPLVLRTRGASVAGLLEPAYEVGGDCFDYAVNGRRLDVAIFDAMGHGVASSMLSGLTVGAYRHLRRQRLELDVISRHLDDVLAAGFHGDAFTTGQLARLDLDTGELRWVNAGHPLPLLLRRGRLVGPIECRPAVPWGLGPTTPSTASHALEPGDGVLFYTDGVVEAHPPGGEVFGVERLADLAGQHGSEEMAPEEIIRRLVRAVLSHQGQALADDATVVLVRWDGPPGAGHDAAGPPGA